MNNHKQELLDLFKEKSVSYGNFTLSSGKKSSYYFDCKLTTYDPKGFILTGAVVFEFLQPFLNDITAVGGLTMGADPITLSTIGTAADHGFLIKGFSVRKKTKQHGKKKRIEGNLSPGDKVVIFDDVVTTGSSTISAIEAVEEFGSEITQVMCLVDRGEGGKEAIIARGYVFQSIFVLNDLLSEKHKYESIT